jgi:drug/metabolite transporter (DMT)-like permease
MAAVNTVNLIRLLSLAAIWGGSFLFMRIAAPIIGPVLLIESRVGLGAAFLLLVSWALKRQINLREHWRHYLVLGLVNSALPFLLFAFAAKTLSASMLSVLNATAPIWGAMIVATVTGAGLSARTSVGLGLGVIGVIVLLGFDALAVQPGATLAMLAALGAAFSYGVATTYARTAKKVDAFSNAHGSMWAATLLVLPATPFFPAVSSPGPGVMVAVLALGIVCSGIAYLLYFRLIADLGAASALTVTFLIPAFGILWGHLFLNEQIGWHTMIGSTIVIIGTALVTGFSPKGLLPHKLS